MSWCQRGRGVGCRQHDTSTPVAVAFAKTSVHQIFLSHCEERWLSEQRQEGRRIADATIQAASPARNPAYSLRAPSRDEGTRDMADQRARYRDALRHRDFRLLTTSFIVDQVGSWAYNVVLIVWVFDKTHSPGSISATTAAGWLPRALFSPYAGVLADRYERSKVMLASALACFVSMTVVALVVAKNGPVLVALALSATTT